MYGRSEGNRRRRNGSPPTKRTLLFDLVVVVVVLAWHWLAAYIRLFDHSRHSSALLLLCVNCRVHHTKNGGSNKNDGICAHTHTRENEAILFSVFVCVCASPRMHMDWFNGLFGRMELEYETHSNRTEQSVCGHIIHI